MLTLTLLLSATPQPVPQDPRPGWVDPIPIT